MAWVEPGVVRQHVEDPEFDVVDQRGKPFGIDTCSPSPCLDSQFLALLWNSTFVIDRLKVKAWSTSGIHTLSLSKLTDIQLPLPPLAEQRRIVTVLDDHLSRLDAGSAVVEGGLRRLDLLAKRIIVDAVPIPSPPHWELTTVGEAES